MKRNEVIGQHYQSHEIVRLRFENGVVVGQEQLPKSKANGWWIAPCLLDLQVNGFAGVDFQSDDLTHDQIEHAVRALHLSGCGRFLLTLITDQWDRLLERLQRLREARTRSPILRNAVLGWHIEGPFLSSKPGFYGAHNPAYVIDPTSEHIRALRSAAGTDLVMLTLAPERAGAIEAIKLARSLGIRVSLGHTDACADTLAEAVRAGATAFTHLGNGCPPSWDRHDNILWRVFETSGLTVTVIPDTVHVSPPLFRLLHRVFSPDAIVYISDGMAAAGVQAGRYRLGHLEIDVGADTVVRLPGSTQYAGSTLRPIDGVFRAARMLGAPWQRTWQHFERTPANWLGLDYGLAQGASADFCLLKVTPDDRLDRLRCFIAGHEIEADVVGH